MKKLFLLCAAIIFFSNLQAQLLKRLGDRAKQKVEQKAGEKVDRSIDDAVDGKKKEKAPQTDHSGSSAPGESGSQSSETASSSGETTVSNNNGANNETPEASATLKTYSKYDFIPGEKILVYENFATDAIGDFPAKWNTNSSGEMVNVDGREGKWLKIHKEGAYHPEFITSFPENFTLEFDLGVNNKFSFYSTELSLAFVNLAKPEQFADFGKYMRWNGKHGVRLDFHPEAGGNKGLSGLKTSVDGNYLIDNKVGVNEFNSSTKNIAHVAIWRQNQRMRVYVNNEKVWDVPRTFGADATYNALVFGANTFHLEQDFYILNNIRLAVGSADTRNKFIKEGKFVTRGILFDVSSDQIKPESYGTIKEMAAVLNENSGVKVKIIGHTDSDGDDKTNMDLSRKRAESVKNALIREFSVDGSRIETDGKGESQPVDKSETVVGKANNRRVEFIKL